MNFQTMAENLVLFNIRFEKNLVTLFTEAPTNFTAFTKKLVNNLIMLIIVVLTFKMSFNIFDSIIH